MIIYSPSKTCQNIKLAFRSRCSRKHYIQLRICHNSTHWLIRIWQVRNEISRCVGHIWVKRCISLRAVKPCSAFLRETMYYGTCSNQMNEGNPRLGSTQPLWVTISVILDQIWRIHQSGKPTTDNGYWSKHLGQCVKANWFD